MNIKIYNNNNINCNYEFTLKHKCLPIISNIFKFSLVSSKMFNDGLLLLGDEFTLFKQTQQISIFYFAKNVILYLKDFIYL